MSKQNSNLSLKNILTFNNFEIAVILFCLSAIMQLIYFYCLPISYTIDSYAYIYGNATVRPHGYDWFLNLLGVNFFKNIIIVICVQVILISLVPPIVFLTAVSSGRMSAFIAAFISLFYGYMYTMSVQIMSESLFIFGCVFTIYLISLYHSNNKIYLLLLIFLSLILTSEVRQSSVPLFGGLFLIVLLMTLKLRKMKILLHSFLVLFVFFSYSSTRSLFNDKSGLDLMPFFVVHWITNINTDNWEISGDKEEFSSRIIDKNNGPKSQEFTNYLKKLFVEHENLYVVMSSARTPTGSLDKQRNDFKVYNEKNINRLVDDIIYNRKYTAHRWPALVSYMWEVFGVKKTTELLNSAIFEGLMQNPLFFERFFIEQFLNSIKTGQALHDNVYWWFIPSRDIPVGILDQFPLSAAAYASWLYSLEDKTGNDPIAKKGEGGVLAYTPHYNNDMSLIWNSKSSKINPYESFRQYNNITAPAIYVASFFTRILAILFLLSFPVLAIFSLFSKQKEIVIPILGSVTLIIAVSFFGALAPRQIFIHIPLLFAVLGMGLGGFNEIVFKFTKFIKNKLK